MIDDITGHPLRSLELRVLTSKHRELHLHTADGAFVLGFGVGAMDRWWINAPGDDFYGDDIAEVIEKAGAMYPGIEAWEGWTE